VVGKYFDTGDFVLSDSYISVIEALKYAGFSNKIKVDLSWIDSKTFEKEKDKNYITKINII
jgi:CTP synthase